MGALTQQLRLSLGVAAGGLILLAVAVELQLRLCAARPLQQRVTILLLSTMQQSLDLSVII